MFHKIKSIAPADGQTLVVRFLSGETKLYDVSFLYDKWPIFKQLEDPLLFNQAQVSPGGYGVIWNDDIDISCNELYENGRIM